MQTVRPSFLIPWNASPRTISERRVGGKAWNLFRLVEGGSSVPPWLVVSTEVFDTLVEPHRTWIEDTLSPVDFGNRGQVQQASLEVRRLIEHLELDEALLRKLRSLTEDLLGSGAPLAVRSSVLGEDSGRDSFAGQMDSLLNVRLEDLQEAIRHVWASAFSERALVYRHRKGIGFDRLSQAVIVQVLVTAVSSGVLFTREPGNGAASCVIAAARGLGEGVVAGSVITDTYRIDRLTGRITCDVPEKDCRVVCDEGSSRGTRLDALPKALRSSPVLSERQLLELKDAALQAERHFGEPLDMEWAVDGHGALHWLQARPIPGGQAVEAPPGRVQVWDCSNIVESYPGLTLPLTFSFARRNYEAIFRRAVRGFGPGRRMLREKDSLFRGLIGLLEGRVYYNLTAWYGMYSLVPGFRKNKQAFDRMIGVAEELQFQAERPGIARRLSAILRVAWRLGSLRRTGRRFQARFRGTCQRLEALDIPTADEEDLLVMFEAFERDSHEYWHLTLYNDFCAMRYHEWLQRLCSRPQLAGRPGLCNDLLQGVSRIQSVEPVRWLKRMADRVCGDPDLVKMLEERSDGEFWEIVHDRDEHRGLREVLDDYVSRLGDRMVEDLKLERPDLREDPRPLVRLLRGFVRAGEAPEEPEPCDSDTRRDAERFVRERLRNPLHRWLFAAVLRRARLSITNRENMRFARTRLFGHARRVFRRLGVLLAGRGLLDGPEDIHFLTVEEVFGCIRGTGVTRDLMSLVELRRGEYRDFARRSLPRRFETSGIPRVNRFEVKEAIPRGGGEIQGTGCSSGRAEGSAMVVRDPSGVDDARGRILVAASTDPGWVFLMVASRGIVVEKGSLLSHTAIVGRELGVPTVVGATGCVDRIPEGARVRLDGSTGVVRWE